MRPLESRLSANVFLHVPASPVHRPLRPQSSSSSSSSSVRKSRRTLVFFIPGNPGLIGYYRPFLALVARGLRGARCDGVHGSEGEGEGEHAEDEQRHGEGAVNEDENDGRGESCAQAVVAGLSLGGFDVDEEETSQREQQNIFQARDEDEKDEKDDGIPPPRPHRPVIENRELLYPPSFSRRFHGAQHQENHTQAGHEGNGPAVAAEEQRRVYTLREQIELSYARVEYLVERLQGQLQGHKEPVVVQVVLVGHSVGAYIALELVRLWHERHRRHHHHRQNVVPSYTTADSDEGPSRSTLDNTSCYEPRKPRTPSRPSWSVSTCILLTPTIQDIHLSPSGRLATPALSHLTFLPGLAHMLLHTVLLRLLPPAWFSALVAHATGMHPGSHGFETTMAFLKSRSGVRQALFMARAEMKEIRSDAWGREVWGASHGGDAPTVAAEEGDRERSTTGPRLFFWFAKKDHWVADVTKEAIFRSKAGDAGVQRDSLAGPRTDQEFGEAEEVVTQQDHTGTATTRAARIHILETEAMVHAWCLNQSETVARRVSLWLRDVLDEDSSLLQDGNSVSQ